MMIMMMSKMRVERVMTIATLSTISVEEHLVLMLELLLIYVIR